MTHQAKKIYTSGGFGLIEIVVGVSIISLALMGTVFLGGSYEKLSRSTLAAVKAEFLLEEGVEGLRSMRDTGWQNIAWLVSGASYFIDFNNGVYVATTSPQIIDGVYTRTVTVASVYRDSNFRIVSNGESLDNETKDVTISIEWREGNATTTRSLRTYLANLFE